MIAVREGALFARPWQLSLCVVCMHAYPSQGVGGVLEVVRPKVGAAEGPVGGGSRGPPPGKFCKKRHNILRSGNFWHTDCAVN